MDVSRYRSYGIRTIILAGMLLVFGLIYTGGLTWNMVNPPENPVWHAAREASITDRIVQWIVLGVLVLIVVVWPESNRVHGVNVLDRCNQMELEKGIYDPRTGIVYDIKGNVLTTPDSREAQMRTEAERGFEESLQHEWR